MRRLPLAVLALALAGAVLADPPPTLLLDWPAGPRRRERVAYVAASLAPIPLRTVRPTPAERLEGAPFVTDGQRVGLDLEVLGEATAGELRAAAATREPAGRLDPLELYRGAEGGYQRARPFPATWDALREELGIGADPRWQEVAVASAIVGAIRHVRFPAEAVLDAALAARAAGEPTRFPVGTAFVAEERDAAGHPHEVHVLRKRADRDWDFALYDHEGHRRTASPAQPNRFRVPMTCAACHLNPVRLPPFTVFPELAPPIGGFQPRVEFPMDATEEALAAELTERARPADRVLGSYAGIVAVRLARAAAAGDLAGWEVGAWARLEAAGLTAARR